MNAARLTMMRIAPAVGAALFLAACQDGAGSPAEPDSRTASTELEPAAGAVLGYIASYGGAAVKVFSAPTSQVVATVGVPGRPASVAVTPDGAFAYATLATTRAVGVINTATNQFVRSIPLGGDPRGIAFTPDGGFAYVATGTVNTVSVINTATRAVVATVPVGQSPEGIAVLPNGLVAFVANNWSHSITVINTATNTAVGTVSLARAPKDIAISPDGIYAYVTAEDTVYVINTVSRSVTTRIPVAFDAAGVVPAPDGSRIYVASRQAGIVSVINTANWSQIAAIPVRIGVVDLAITPDGALVYATEYPNGSAAVINTATNTLFGRMTSLDYPMGVALAQVTVPPRAHRSPPSGTILGIAEKSFVEVCNAYTGGFGPTATVRVIAQVQQQTGWRTLDNFTVSLTEGACQDVWFNPLDASTRVLITELPITGVNPSCTVNQVGPGSTKLTKACTNATQALVFTNLDTGFLVEYTNR